MEDSIKNDIELLADVRRAIEAQPGMENEPIGVAVHDGIVMLTGAVNSYAKKWSAEPSAIRDSRYEDRIGGG
jgi:osmotically-inducible protein OsmY